MLETITAADAKDGIEELIDSAAESHRPILIISGGDNNAVLLSEEDWNALQEKIYLLSVPGMYESIVKEMNSPDNEFMTEEDFLNELEKEDKN